MGQWGQSMIARFGAVLCAQTLVRSVLVVGLLAAINQPAHGAVSLPPDIVSAKAVNAATAYAYSAQGCPPGTSRFAVSTDRGATWTRESVASCSQWSREGRVGDRVLVVAPDGVTAALMAADFTRTPTAAPSPATRLTALSGSVFETGQSWRRLNEDLATWISCGALPGTSVFLRWWRTERGIYALRKLGDGSTVIARSTDACQTWTTMPGPGCTPTFVTSHGYGIVVFCGVGGQFETFDDQQWRPAARFVSSDAGTFVYVDATRIRLVDLLADLSDPATWTTWRPAASDPGVPTDQAAIIEGLNERYRRPLGLPDIAWNSRSAQMAANHVKYLTLNPGRHVGLDQHNETPGAPGFTGATGRDRCLAVDAPCFGEVLNFGRTLENAVRSWLNTPFHGPFFFYSATVGFAGSPAGISGGAVDPAGQFGLLAGELDTTAASNTPQSLLRVWPTNGTQEVPIRWSGGEIPDPLQNYTGDRASIGPTLHVLAYRPPVEVRLDGPSGPEPLLIPSEETSANIVNMGTALQDFQGAVQSLPFLVARELRGQTAYTLRVTDADGRVALNTFTTEAGTARIPRQPRLIVTVRMRSFRPVATTAMRTRRGGLPVTIDSPIAASASVRYERGVRGHLQGRGCKPGAPTRRQRACLIWKAAPGTLTVNLARGVSGFRLSGVAARRRLPTGSYRILVKTRSSKVFAARSGAFQILAAGR